MFCVTTVDWTPLEESAYFKETMERLEKTNLEGADSGFLLAGWAKVNFTPASPKPLIPYKPRGEYEFVVDSSYVKTLLISNEQHTVALINYELLFVHPYLAQKVEERLKTADLPVDHLYFTSTHTHRGMGGYTPGIVGKLTMGGKDEMLVDFIAHQTIESVNRAFQHLDTVNISYRKTPVPELVANRLVASDPVDPYVRQLYLEKLDGETCLFVTYSAHPTLLESDFMGLSGDYPYYFAEALEEELSFCIFAAGTVGSHRPQGAKARDTAAVREYARTLYQKLHSDLSPADTSSATSLFSAKLQVDLRSPHFRISENLRLRPWLFHSVYGESPAFMDILQIGPVVLLSSSGEVSGVFYENWDKHAASLDLTLFFTSFNGGYIGYITPDKYYKERMYETWDMNFFGPFNGAYQHELVVKALSKVKHN